MHDFYQFKKEKAMDARGKMSKSSETKNFTLKPQNYHYNPAKFLVHIKIFVSDTFVAIEGVLRPFLPFFLKSYPRMQSILGAWKPFGKKNSPITKPPP